MKKAFFTLITITTLTACDVLQQVVGENVNMDPNNVLAGDIINRFNRQNPVSTTFEDAIYEVNELYNFEPQESEYRPLHLQPRAVDGGFLLKSGLYTMNARSFCLKGYTYGPSRGDGHLYAPLKGKKADFVELILKRYGERPNVQQKNVQVLLWAIIAGADMESLGQNYSNTLSQLFSARELLEFQGKDWLSGIADEQIQRFKSLAMNSMSPKLRNMLEADNTLRTLIGQNKSFQEIERIAIIAGVAPEADMIRSVSKGRWSYHSNGFFVRFFPNGYPQTRIDVYVPREGEVVQDQRGAFQHMDRSGERRDIEVVFQPTQMVAMPANQSSQRIGLSEVPADLCDNLQIDPGVNISYRFKNLANNLAVPSIETGIENEGITCAYIDMYLSNPGKFKWAGLAALVSGEIGKSINDYPFNFWDTESIRNFRDDIIKGNRDVFDDLFWQHIAYNEGGLEQLEDIYCNGEMSKDALYAWYLIDQGNVWEGNLRLLYHEQKNVLQPTMYNVPEGELNDWWWADSWVGILFQGWKNPFVSPVPGDNRTFPGNDLSKFNERWNWIESQIIPSWRQYEENENNRENLLNEFREICTSCCR